MAQQTSLEYWFRGKKSNGDWEYGGINDKGDCIISYHQFIPVDPATIGLHTGAHDIYQHSIYHGDILRMVDSPEELLIVVTWTKCGWAFELHENSVVDQFPDHFTMKRCEIVGNIWDGILRK